MTVVEIAETLGFSRRPVIDALKRLEVEQFVEIVPQTGVFVKRYTEEEILDHFTAVMALEGLAACLAAERGQPEQLDALKAANRELEEVVSRPFKKEEYFSCNRRFHYVILRMAQSKKLMSLLPAQWNLNDFFLTNISFFEQDFKRTIGEHERIIEAIAHRDRDLARFRMEEHFQTFIQMVKQSLSIRR
ncbi:GntR family transcriptional regulator [Hydrogenibacillus sp. N12]|nr:GntR family transcriptional regulator [Hydrogenibacillus sp. N12]